MLNDHNSEMLFQELSANAHNQMIYQTVAILGAKLSKDGNQWCYLLGDNLQEGVAGFGNTPYLAVLDFYHSYHNEKATAKAKETD